MDKELASLIRQHNVLVVDDVTTGSTLNEVLSALRNLNDDNNKAVFSIDG